MFRFLKQSAAALVFTFALFAAKSEISADTLDHAGAYLEWLLDVRFTAEQRQHCQQMFADLWRAGKPGAAETIETMARAGKALPEIAESDRARLRASKQADFVHVLETRTDDNSRWLLAIYRDSHSTASLPASVPASGPLGRWSISHISSIQYKNAYTGVSAPTNGQSFTYEFQPDGTYSYTGLMQFVNYNCTNATFSHETGTYTVEGNSIALHPEKNPYRMTNNCAPSSNHESPGKLISRTYRFRFLTENGRRYLELRGDDGALQKFAESPR